MKVFIPMTQLQPATEIYTLDKTVDPGADYTQVDVSSDSLAYTRYLEGRWQQRDSFVNMEHDVVPWPGAINQIWYCPYPWCFYGYVPDVDCVENNCAPFGLVKFSSELIKTFPEVWSKMREYYAEDFEYVWQYHDVWMFEYVVNKLEGPRPHQHYPAVFNANPKILESR